MRGIPERTIEPAGSQQERVYTDDEVRAIEPLQRILWRTVREEQAGNEGSGSPVGKSPKEMAT